MNKQALMLLRSSLQEFESAGMLKIDERENLRRGRIGSLARSLKRRAGSIQKGPMKGKFRRVMLQLLHGLAEIEALPYYDPQVKKLFLDAMHNRALAQLGRVAPGENRRGRLMGKAQARLAQEPRLLLRVSIEQFDEDTYDARPFLDLLSRRLP